MLSRFMEGWIQGCYGMAYSGSKGIVGVQAFPGMASELRLLTTTYNSLHIPFSLLCDPNFDF